MTHKFYFYRNFNIKNDKSELKNYIKKDNSKLYNWKKKDNSE